MAALDQDDGCAAKTIDNACVGNESFHAAKAQTCLDQLGKLDCGQIRDQVDIANAAPACTQVCSID